jgi:hypothetical protein
MARRDIWLGRKTSWHIVARQGDVETGHVHAWEFPTEEAARTMVQRLMDANGPGQWREQESRGPVPDPDDTRQR